MQKKPEEQESIGVVVSLGTGRVPDVPIHLLDCDLATHPYAAAVSMKNLAVMMVDQVNWINC